MQLKRYQKSGCSAVWSQSKNYSDILAATSYNNENQNLFDLQLLSIDFGSRSKNLNLLGRAVYNNPFRCLAWGTYGEKDESFPYGLIFGGMENGGFTLWSPAQMLQITKTINQEQIEEQRALLYVDEPEQQSYPILCAEWNNLKNNFLAFGSTNLLLLDVGKDVTNPDILKPSQNNPHEGSYISSVSWNKQVAHILASAGSDGLIALWDIKTNKSIFQFKDSGPSTAFRQVEIAWSKHISTQIAVTLDDDKKNELQIWDLRNQKGPIVVIDKVHTKGINSIDWSDIDHDLILASSRDRRVSCWNYKQDETPLSTIQFSDDVEKVAWSKSLSSIYSVTTKTSLQIYSMDDKNLLNYVPKWLKIPIGSAFNGNDSLVVYSEQKGNKMEEYKINIQIKKGISENISLLQQYFENGADSLKQLEGNQGDFWKLIATKQSQQSDSDIYTFLGFNKDKIMSQVQKYTGKKRSSLAENTSKKKNKVTKADYIPVSGEAAASFFGSLGTSDTQKRKQSFTELELQNIKYDTVQLNNNWDIGKEKLIKQNMLIGNYDGAIDAALKCGRTAQALIIAYSVDQNTFNNTLKTFFTETTDHFISDILKHIAFKDTEQLVSKYDLNKWKQCIALIYSISTGQKRKNLLRLLGERICEQQSNNQELVEAAINCFILADEFEKVVENFSKRLKFATNISERKALAVYYGTKILGIYQSLNIQVQQSADFDRILRETALVCLEVGKKVLAYNIFSKYLASSSFKFINYLVNTTQQLVQYRKDQIFTVSLPVMRRQTNVHEGKSKKTQKKQNPHQKPTNIKPQPKVYSHPLQTHPSEEQVQNKTQAEAYMEANRKRNNPPPAPPKKFNPPKVIGTVSPKYEEEEQKKHTPQLGGQSQKKIPPPPGPPKNSNKSTKNYPPSQAHINTAQNTQAPEDSFHEDRKPIPRPPIKKVNQPPHTPPPIYSNKNQQKEEEMRNDHKNIVPPQKGTRNIPPPKPKLNYHKQQYQQVNKISPQVHEPPPPSQNKVLPPPHKNAPVAKNVPPMMVSRPPALSSGIQKPVNKMKPPQHFSPEQQQDEIGSQEEYEQQNQSKTIQSPQVKKVPPPPMATRGKVVPPKKPMIVQQDKHDQQDNEPATQIQPKIPAGRRAPPPQRR